MSRPATGKTPIRGVRVPEGLWQDAKHIAATRGDTLSDVIVRALHRYVRDHANEPDSR